MPTRTYRSIGPCLVILAGLLLSRTSAHAQTATPVEATASAPAPIVEPAPSTADEHAAPAETAAVAPVVPATPAAATPRPLQVSFDDGARVESADSRFGVRIGAVTQFRAQLDQTAAGHFQGHFNTFYVRPQIRMHAFGNQLNVFIQPEFSGTGARLLDFEVAYQPRAAIGIKVGQFMTPFSRAWLTPIPVMHMADFGAANDYFRWGRDTGVMIMGQPFEGRLEYYVGVFNGNGINQPTSQTVHGLGVARLVYSPLGAVPYDQTRFLAGDQPLRFSIGLDGYAGRQSYYRTITDLTTGKPVTVQDPNQTHMTVGMDFALNVNRLTVLAEGYFRRNVVQGATNAGTDAMGLTAQAGYYFPGPHLELATRATYTNQNVGMATNWLATYEGGVNGYVHGNHAKLMIRYLYADTGSGFTATSTSPIGTYFAGRQHRLMAEAQVFF